MALSYDIHTSIIIDNVPPAFVRQTFLDFDNYPSWSPKYIIEIKVLEYAGGSGALADPTRLAAGSKIAVAMSTVPEQGLITMPVVTNTKDEFAWTGGVSFPFALRARHSFAFKPAGPGGQSTEFVQSEHLSGFLTAYVSYGSFGAALEKAFKEFNAEIKARCQDTYKP